MRQPLHPSVRSCKARTKPSLAAKDGARCATYSATSFFENGSSRYITRPARANERVQCNAAGR
jgi:hypothetical protein